MIVHKLNCNLVFELGNPFASQVVTEITKLYIAQGRMEEASKMEDEMRKAQEGRTCDKVNPSFVSDTDRKEKRWIDEIAALHCEVFEVRAARYGEDHPSTLEAMENLAEMYNRLGRTTDASVLNGRMTEIHKRRLSRLEVRKETTHMGKVN